MQELLTKIIAAMDEFKADATKRVAGNKAAGTRSRVKGQELREMLKEWSKVSTEKA